MGQGSSQCLAVTVTITARPTIRYSPLTISWEKRPDRSSPLRVAPFLRAAFLALASSVEGSTVVSRLKVLATIHFLPYLWNASTIGPRVALGRYVHLQTPPPRGQEGVSANCGLRGF